MTATRIGIALIVIGIVAFTMGALKVVNDDLGTIGGVGLIVLGAVSVCIATDQR